MRLTQLGARLLLGAGVLAASPSAQAYSTANLGTSVIAPRLCHDERERATPPSPAPTAPPLLPSLVPLRRIAPPAPLFIVPHTVDDAAWAEPIPERIAPPGTERPAPGLPGGPVLHESSNTWGCLGLARGQAGILRVLAAPPGARFYGHPSAADWLGDNILAAAAFNLKGGIPALRGLLERTPLPKTDIQQLSLRAQAAHALAVLDDRAWLPRLMAFTEELESAALVSVWENTFLSLELLDPEAASRYATALVERLSRTDAPPLDKFAVVLDRLLPRDAERALPALRAISAASSSPRSYPGHAMCAVLATRIRLGDAALAKELRPAMVGTLDTNLATVCYAALVAAMAPGRDIAELPVLAHRARYHELAQLALRLRGRKDAAAPRERTLLLRTLRAQWAAAAPAFANRRGSLGVDRQYGELLSALALAGDGPGTSELLSLVTSADEPDNAPWIAARYAVLGDLPGAREAATRRLELGMRRYPERGNVDDRTVGVVVTEPVLLVRALAAKGDPAWSLGLLQRDWSAREEAILTVSRRAAPETCELVTNAARQATGEAVDAAFWALSVLGDACRPSMDRLAHDPRAPDVVRGMALEHLAMIRADSAAGLLHVGQAQASSGLRLHLERTSRILGSPE
jgi:hypothetical protein